MFRGYATVAKFKFSSEGGTVSFKFGGDAFVYNDDSFEAYNEFCLYGYFKPNITVDDGTCYLSFDRTDEIKDPKKFEKFIKDCLDAFFALQGDENFENLIGYLEA